MRTVNTNITIADFCTGLERGEYEVNRDYQRSDKVWPTAAKSFLIETVLLDYPVPKLSLHQVLDVNARKTVNQIVDGQQRSTALLEFFQNRLRLSRQLENDDLANRIFDELTDEYKTAFLRYALNFDIFTGASSDEVREVFRRMNSFNVPLNPEETRHAQYQGPFKWFILELTRRYDDAFAERGVFTSKQLNRMADSKLLTEICHALDFGITTTNKATLDRIYRKFDREFESEDRMRAALQGGIELALFETSIRGTALAKPLNLYALVLAYIEMAGLWQVSVPNPVAASGLFVHDDAAFNLSILADALEQDRVEPQLLPFTAAARDRTNVAAQRKTRFDHFYAAITA